MHPLAKNLLNPEIIVALLMLPMAWHVFGFYSAEPILIRILLAASFEIIALFLFSMLVRKDSYKPTIWAALTILISFQAYVNIYQLWDAKARLKSFIGGGIFPVLFALSVFLIARHEERERIADQRRNKRQPQFVDVDKMMPATPLQQSKTTGNVTREEVMQAFNDGLPVTYFAKSGNYRSVRRWYEQLQKERA
jgi:hypothetical protein